MPQVVCEFEVVVWEPRAWDGAPMSGAELGEVLVGKEFRGAVDGVSHARLLTARSSDHTATYSGMETFSGTVEGLAGNFAYAHSATIVDGAPLEHYFVIVPGSGTGQLEGITGTGRFHADETGHTLTLDYSLPART